MVAVPRKSHSQYQERCSVRGKGVQYYNIHFCSSKGGFAVPGESHSQDEEMFAVRGKGV